MSYRRTLAAAAALVAAVVIAPQALPASATPHPGAVTTAPRAGGSLIQGVVTDRSGRYLDDVTVQATKADGTPAASAETYASDREDGPQHGYFFLEVGRGNFTLTLSRPRYKTATYGPFEISRRRQRLSLGEIEIVKLLPETKTVAALARKSITTKQNGVVEVTVRAKDARPTGTVEIRAGRGVVGEGRLKRIDKGHLVVGLDRLSRGTHELKAYYLGSSSLRASASSSFTLTVTRARH